VLHNVVHFYLKNKKLGKVISEEELIQEYLNKWINEGFLSREHEEMRKKAGENALRLFYQREKNSSIVPEFLEKNFKWFFNDNTKFIGRWDRVDITNGGAIIIDFKATSVKDQKEADKKTKESLQMDIYALSFTKTLDIPLVGTQLYFLESNIIGHAKKKEKELDRAADKIEKAEFGISNQDFSAKPDWHNCRYCDFKTICPSSYAY